MRQAQAQHLEGFDEGFWNEPNKDQMRPNEDDTSKFIIHFLGGIPRFPEAQIYKRQITLL